VLPEAAQDKASPESDMAPGGKGDAPDELPPATVSKQRGAAPVRPRIQWPSEDASEVRGISRDTYEAMPLSSFMIA
jgi:hypothetical protein